jgi:O-antigen/teichoic acid export membrane protein
VVKLLSPTVGRGTIYLYLQFLSSIIAGYIFWIFATKFTTTETIGNFALIISLSAIFANIAIIGIPDGIQRFLAKSFSEKKLSDARVFVKISLIFLFVGITTSSTLLLIFSGWFLSTFGIPLESIIIIDLLLGAYATYLVLYSIVIASLQTKMLPIIVIVSSGSKVVVGTIVVLMDVGVFGLALGYSFLGNTISSILIAVIIIKLFKVTEINRKAEVVEIKHASKNLLTASVVAWIPNLITTVGLELGTLVVFGIWGPDQSGIYFIVITLVSGINSILYSLFTIALPFLSSMVDGRKRFAWETIRMSSIIMLPISFSLFFYAKDVMQLFGPSYVEGTLLFQILLLSVFPSIVAGGVETLVYSYGHYRRSLAITIVMNVLRAFLYFIMVPNYGITGAGISYTLGAIIGFSMSVIVAKSIPMKIAWKSLLLVLIIPMAINFLVAAMHITYIIGIPFTLVISYLILIKLRILTRPDIIYLIELLPCRVSKPLIRGFTKIEKAFDKFYGT